MHYTARHIVNLRLSESKASELALPSVSRFDGTSNFVNAPQIVAQMFGSLGILYKHTHTHTHSLLARLTLLIFAPTRVNIRLSLVQDKGSRIVF